MLRKHLVFILTSLVSLTPGVSYAQASGPAPPRSFEVEQTDRPLDPRIVRASVEKWQFETGDEAVPPVVQIKRRPSNAKRAALIAVGTVAGFFAGAYAGSMIENQFAPCNCDDPGLLGVLWGAPIGALVGAVTTAIVVK